MAKITSVDSDGVISPQVSGDELEAAMRKQRSAESEMVRLIALTMKSSSKIQIPAARGFKYVTVGPLEISPPVPLDYAKRVIQPKRINSRTVRPVIIWQLAPEARPKNAKKTSFTVASGLKFNTDIYAPEEGLEIFGRKIYHSVSQSQHFIAKVLRTKAGIHRFITEFDTRPDVAGYGNYMISEKDREEREMLGMSARSLVTV
jgi:hypothetical protein